MNALLPLLLLVAPVGPLAGGYVLARHVRRRTSYAPRVVFAGVAAGWVALTPVVLVLPYGPAAALVFTEALGAAGAGFYVRSRWLPQDSGVGELGQRHRERLGIKDLMRSLSGTDARADAVRGAIAGLVAQDEIGHPRAVLGHEITRGGEFKPNAITVPIGRTNFGVVALMMGGPGTGKTTTAIRLLWAGAEAAPTCSIVIADPKGDPALRENARDIAEHYGMTFWEWTRETPLDPLASVSGHYEERVVDVVERLMAISTWEGNAEFYAAVTRVAWQRAARYVLAAEKPLSLKAMADALSEMGAKRLLAAMRAHGRDNAAEELHAWIEEQSPAKWNALTDVRARLESLATSGPGLKLAPHEHGGTSLEELLSRPTVAYLHLDSNRWPAAGKEIAQLLAVALMQDAGAVAEQGRVVRLFVDELAAVPAERLDALLQRGRSAGFDVYLATQTLAGIGAVNAALTSQITGTLSYAIAHASLGQSEGGEDDAERIGRMAGTRIEQEITTQVHGGPVALPTGAGSSRQVDSYIVHPNTIRSLGQGQAAVIDIRQPTRSADRARLAQIVAHDARDRGPRRSPDGGSIAAARALPRPNEASTLEGAPLSAAAAARISAQRVPSPSAAALTPTDAAQPIKQPVARRPGPLSPW